MACCLHAELSRHRGAAPEPNDPHHPQSCGDLFRWCVPVYCRKQRLQAQVRHLCSWDWHISRGLWFLFLATAATTIYMYTDAYLCMYIYIYVYTYMVCIHTHMSVRGHNISLTKHNDALSKYVRARHLETAFAQGAELRRPQTRTLLRGPRLVIITLKLQLSP